ncbi:MAG: CDP-alcohol phosphatidyltransferase family protein [Clostridia bacterium]|nr:CDP-alcohol phosphatidyltransferase family protein [Clostridia bacterium]
MKLSIKKNINVPNTLTVIRLIVIIPMIKFLLEQKYVYAGIMILISALSDMMDGFLARRLDQVTDLGKILDPIADKLTLIAVVVCVNVLYPEVMPFVLVLFSKELLMLAGGAFLLKVRIRPPAAKWYGKLSTVLFYTSITTLIILKAVWGYTNETLSMTLLAVTTASMLFSLVRYFILFVKLVKEKNKAEKTAQSVQPQSDGE